MKNDMGYQSNIRVLVEVGKRPEYAYLLSGLVKSELPSVMSSPNTATSRRLRIPKMKRTEKFERQLKNLTKRN